MIQKYEIPTRKGPGCVTLTKDHFLASILHFGEDCDGKLCVWVITSKAQGQYYFSYEILFTGDTRFSDGELAHGSLESLTHISTKTGSVLHFFRR